MKVCPPKSKSSQWNNQKPLLIENQNKDISVEYTRKILDYFFGFKYKVIINVGSEVQTSHFLSPVKVAIGNEKEVIVEEKGDSSKLISFEGTIRADNSYLSSGKLILNLGSFSFDLNLGIDKFGVSANYDNGVSINSIALITKIKKLQLLGVSIENTKDHEKNYTYTYLDGTLAIIIVQALTRKWTNGLVLGSQ